VASFFHALKTFNFRKNITTSECFSIAMKEENDYSIAMKEENDYSIAMKEQNDYSIAMK